MPPSIVIVGNGPSLLGRRLGLSIDAFPTVVRINNYRIAGFEPDTGTRTTVRVVNSGYLRNNGITPTPPGIQTIVCNGVFPNPETPDCDWAPPKVANLPPGLPCFFWNDPRIPEHSWASTGLVAVKLFSMFSPVCIAGFDCFASSRHHYWNDGKICHFHNAEAEKIILQDWIRNGKVIEL